MPKSLLAEFLRAGITFTLDGDRLVMHGHKDLPKAERARMVERFKSLKDVRDEVIAELKERNDTRRGYSYDSAHEFMQYCLAGHVQLQSDGQGMWWSAPDYEADPGSLSFLAEIWSECVLLLFEWKAQGKLDEHIQARLKLKKLKPVAQPLPTENKAKKLRKKSFKNACAWIIPRLDELKSHGWTLKSLFAPGHGHGKKRIRGCGAAWLPVWEKPEKVTLEPDGSIRFKLDEPLRTVYQSAYLPVYSQQPRQ